MVGDEGNDGTDVLHLGGVVGLVVENLSVKVAGLALGDLESSDHNRDFDQRSRGEFFFFVDTKPGAVVEVAVINGSEADLLLSNLSVDIFSD